MDVTHPQSRARNNEHRVDLKVLAESIGWILTGAAVGLAAVILAGLGIIGLDRKSAPPPVVDTIADSPLTSQSVPASDPMSPGSKR